MKIKLQSLEAKTFIHIDFYVCFIFLLRINWRFNDLTAYTGPRAVLLLMYSGGMIVFIGYLLGNRKTQMFFIKFI